MMIMPFFLERRFMENTEEKYNAGGTFETTIGKTQYEVVMNFKQEGLSMEEKALRAVKEGIPKGDKPA